MNTTNPLKAKRAKNAYTEGLKPKQLPAGYYSADKTAHTPGPWRPFFRHVLANGRFLAKAFEISDQSNGVRFAKGQEPLQNMKEAEANARLVAAAPDLLEALKRLADASATVGNLDHAGAVVPAEAWAEMYAANNAARGILAKAEGRS